MLTVHHAHPITIVSNLWRVLYLIIIPLLRGFFNALNGDFAGWVRGAWIDILIFIAMLALAVWRWRRVSYTLQDDGIQIVSGFLRRHYTRIPMDRVVTMSLIHSFFLRPFRAVYLRADTIGGSFKDADFTILLSPARAEEVMALMRQPPEPEKRDYAPQVKSVLALSFLTSNSLAGVVFISTLITQSGKLLGRGFSNALFGTVETATRHLASGIIPPAAALLAALLLAGWLIAFLRSFLRYKNMLVEKRRHSLSIRGGVFSHREYFIDARDINFLDIRQSLSTKLLRLYSLYISAVGYGKQKDDISCVIPTERADVFRYHQDRLFPGFSPADRDIAPEQRVVFRFIGAPLFCCVAIPVAMLVLIWLFPHWRSFLLFVFLMCMIPAIMLLTVNILDFRTGGVSFDGSKYTLRYSSGLYLHTVIIPQNKVVLLQLRQSPLQSFGESCDLLVYTVAEGVSLHRCRGLRKESLRSLLKIS